MQFVLPVLENGVRQRHSTTLHIMLAFLLFGIGITCEGLYWFTSVSPKFAATGGAYKPFLYFGIASLVASFVILFLNIFQKSWLRKETNNMLFRILELVLLLVGSLLFFMNGWAGPALLFGLMAAVVVFALIREKGNAGNDSIVVSEQGVQLHGAARRKFVSWKEIDNVLLRFGTLTIEYSDNHLLQQSIGTPMPDEDAVEAYSKQQIEKFKLERVSDDW